MDKQKMLSYIKRELPVIFVSVIIGLMITGIITKAYSDTTSENLAAKFIRLHVLANSNSEVDQVLKLKVKDTVMAMLSDRIAQSENIDAAREVLNDSLDDIESVAERVIADCGYSYKATASLSRANFPTRQYGGFVLVAGAYEALRIEIGNATGENWWCVVYPPLCFVDIATGGVSKLEAQEDLRKNLSADEYSLVAETDSLPVKIKFKTVEIWQEMKLSKEAKKALAKKDKDQEILTFK